MDTRFKDASGESMVGVRPDWSHGVASKLQAAVGTIFDANVRQFAAAITCMASDTPAPANLAEARELRVRYLEFTLRIGHDFHALAHRPRMPSCRFLPIESTAHVWFDAQSDPRRLLTRWADTYVDEFTKHHSTPLAWRLAQLVSERFAEKWTPEGFARELGASVSSCTRHMRESVDVTPTEYLTRTRLVRAFDALRHTSAKVDDVARTVGFGRVKNLNRAAQQYVRFTPTAVRTLSHVVYQRLLDKELQCDVVVLERERERETLRL